MVWKRFKSIAAWLHLWLGLATGIIIVLVSVTGSILVFEDELFAFFHRDLIEVAPTGSPKPVSELMAIAQHALGKKKPITDIRVNEAGKSYVFSASKIRKADDIGLTYFSQFKYRYDVYINPYSGKLLGVIDTRYEFFNVTEQLHRQLLLTKPVGSVIIGCCVLIFLVMLITGFVLWLPKNLRQLKKSVSVKWNAKFKRVNYDLHNSLGFYVIPVAIIIAVTGLTWSFKWWEKGIYQMLGSADKVTLVRKAPTITTADTSGNHLNIMLGSLQQQLNGNYRVIGLNLPDKGDKVMMAYVYHKTRTDGWRNLSYYYFDTRTGKQFDQLLHAQKPLGLKWRNSNKDIHTGRIYGLPTQLLALLASLVCASLPITGFLIWWGKRKKTKRPKARQRVLANA